MKNQNYKKVDIPVIQKIMDRAIEIDRQCNEHCRDFQIVTSSEYPNTLILRWISIDLKHDNSPTQCYRYECFNTDGSPQHCGIQYSDQQQANNFFKGIQVVHTQEFAIDHKL